MLSFNRLNPVRNCLPSAICVAVATLTSVSFFTSQASAATIAATPTASGSTVLSSPADGVFGWQFGVSTIIQVTHLGFYDDFNNGLPTTPVGLWTSGGSTLRTTNITTGSTIMGPVFAGPGFNGNFRYNTISPVQLNPGVYVVGGDVNGDQIVFRAASPGTSSPISFHTNRARTTNLGFAFPPTSFGGDGVGYFGANFQYVIPAVTAIPSGGVIDLGVTNIGGPVLTNDDLDVRSTGQSGSYVDLEGITGIAGQFSLTGGNPFAHLNAVSGEIFEFSFDPTGLAPGVYSTNATVRTSLQDFNYVLRATVIPEPATFAQFGLAGLFGLAFVLRRKWG